MNAKHTKQQTVFLVLLALILLAGAALFLLTEQQKQTEQAESEAAEGSISLAAVSADTLEQIVLEYQGETLTLDYADGGWTLAEDPDYHLDTTACNTMLTALTDLRAKRQLTAEAGEDYGMDAPQVTVTVTAAGETDTYCFGAENSVTGDLYLQKQGDASIYTVAGTKAACFQQTKADLFGPFNPAGLTSSAIEAVTLTYPDGQIVSLAALSEPDSSDAAEPDSSSYTTVWRNTADPETDLDDTVVQSLLSALSGYVTGQSTHTDPAEVGFKTLVTAEVTAGETACTLTYGEGTDGYYLTVSGDDSLYSVNGSIVDAIRNF